jgi:6-phosphogluconolactonase
MKKSVKIFQSPFEMAESFASDLTGLITESTKKKKLFTLALSGGNTPGLLFSVISDHFSGSAPWERVHFFWGDERCVPPDDPESNYGMARRKLFDKIGVPQGNIHRIKGEEDPGKEAARYSGEILENTINRNQLPAFDMIILGLGEDGHTASIFPGQDYLLNSGKVCEVAFHPGTMQKRITITGKTINNAGHVVFLVTGKNKAGIIDKIINKNPEAGFFPASSISPLNGDLQWYMDKEAGSLLKP